MLPSGCGAPAGMLIVKPDESPVSPGSDEVRAGAVKLTA